MFPSDTHIPRNLMRRCEIVRVDDAGAQQLVDVRGLADETLKGILRVQPFGERSIPPIGTEGLVLFLGGRPNQGVMISGEHPEFRGPAGLAPGCKAIFNQYGDIISLLVREIRIASPLLRVFAERVDFQLEVDGAGGAVEKGQFAIKGNVILDGDITQVGTITSTGPHQASAFNVG
jgi:phage baseplate assembly protein V